MQDVGKVLEPSLPDIARKVEVALSALWANGSSTSQAEAYFEVIDIMKETMKEIRSWMPDGVPTRAPC